MPPSWRARCPPRSWPPPAADLTTWRKPQRTRAVPTSSETLAKLPADVDLHARPAADFVRAAMGFDAEIVIAHGDREADEEPPRGARPRRKARGDPRSEEHTSELQSQSNLV